MADIRITGTRGGAGLPPEKRQTNLTPECKISIEHTEEVAKRTVFTHYDGVTLNITDKPSVAQKIHKMFFRH